MSKYTYSQLTIPPYTLSDEELFKARKELLSELEKTDVNYNYLYMITAISAAIHDWGLV